MEILQQRFDASPFLNESESAAIGPMSDLCEVSALRQSTFSEFLLDVGWLIKEPASENFQQFITASQIQRFNSLLSFLMCNDSTTILEKLLQKLKILISNMEFNSVAKGTFDADLSLLQKYLDNARAILCKKHKNSESSMQLGTVPKGDHFSESRIQENVLSVSINRKVRTSNFKVSAFADFESRFRVEDLRADMNCCISLFFILANNTNLSGDWIYDFLNIKITAAWPVTCSMALLPFVKTRWRMHN